MNIKKHHKDINAEDKKTFDVSHNDLFTLPKTALLGVAITNASKKSILEYIIKNHQKKLFIVTPNPEMVVYAKANKAFSSVLQHAEIALCDGVGILLAAKVLGKQLQERFTGTDLVESLCEKVVRKPITVGFLGAGPGVAKMASECLCKNYPELNVVYVSEEWKEDFVEENKLKDTHGTKYTLSTAHIDILFVAFGHPKQEYWINEHLRKIDVNVMIGVGGAFDYISGNVPRAPKFLQDIGFEWMYRLSKQPWRIKRQWALLIFIWLVLVERIKLFLRK